MKTIQRLSYIQRLRVGTVSVCTVLSLLTACGGEGSNSSDSTSAENVDGPVVELTAQDDSYSPNEGADNSLKNVSSSAEHRFTASKATAIQIRSVDSIPCHINVYSNFQKASEDTYIPDPTARVMQINSVTCDFSGMLYVMHHWESLLVEVIRIRQTDKEMPNDGTTYYEVTLPSEEITLNIN